MLEGLEGFSGPLAGVTTSVLWTFTALFFTAASRRIGATTVNATRIGIAVIFHGVTHFGTQGTWLPQASAPQVILLALSGLVGLSIGDLALFTAFVHIGPRLAMLMMTTAPIFAVGFGWFALHEHVDPYSLAGMVLTIAGVAWVVLERPAGVHAALRGQRVSGLLLALFAAACQAGGLLLSKAGMGYGWLAEGEQLQPQTATLIRMFFAGIFVLPTVAWLALRQPPVVAPAAGPADGGRRRRGYLLTVGGATVGPYLGVWMSLVAAKHAPLGVAQTLCSLPPVLILPLAVWVYGERVSPRAALGAILAVAGIAVIFLAPALPVVEAAPAAR